MLKRLFLGVSLALLSTPAIASGEQIRIVGSSTVFPFATAAAEQFAKRTNYKAPVVESTGSGGGIKLFCAGVGHEHPDIANASRKIKQSEVDKCASNGVTFRENLIGYDGIVIAESKKTQSFNLTKYELYQALAAKVMVDGQLIDNPYINWSDINANLPNQKIEVLGPPPTSGTRDAFIELVMRKGAEMVPELAAIKSKNKDEFRSIADQIREDGSFIEAGENDNLIVQKIKANPNAIGIFGFSFADQNSDVVRGIEIDGVSPTFENIASGKYGISRSLYFYVKNEHRDTRAGLNEFEAYFISEDMIGEEGFLIDKGLIPK